MSGGLSNLVQVGQSLLLSPPRSIGMIIADCTIEETHRDDLTVTDHPVEVGAAITDHAFKRPAELTIRAGWSNSSPQAAFSSTILGVPTFGIIPSFSEDYVLQVYASLLALQLSRQPFAIATGKRSYTSMLMTSLATTTDRHTEFALFVTATFREIITVTTSTVSLPPSSQMSSPQNNAPQVDNGTQQTTPAPNQSLLSRLNGTSIGSALQRIFQ